MIQNKFKGGEDWVDTTRERRLIAFQILWNPVHIVTFVLASQMPWYSFVETLWMRLQFGHNGNQFIIAFEDEI